MQYEFASRPAFERYVADHAPRLRQEGAQRYGPHQVSYSRRVGEIAADQS